MSEITDDEFTLLMIADNGDALAPIGRWKESVLNLASKGLLERLNEVNYAITEAGRKARAERDREDDASLRHLLESNNKVANARTQAQQSVEQAAQCLVQAVKASVIATGDTPTTALKQWGEIALKRAMELLK